MQHQVININIFLPAQTTSFHKLKKSNVKKVAFGFTCHLENKKLGLFAEQKDNVTLRVVDISMFTALCLLWSPHPLIFSVQWLRSRNF